MVMWLLPAEEPFNTSKTCECGEAKSNRARACRGCQALDGHKAEGLIISALRIGSREGMSLRDICAATGIAHRSAQFITKRMVARGRLRRYESECDTVIAVVPMPGRAGRLTNTGGAKCWMYCLNGREGGRCQ